MGAGQFFEDKASKRCRTPCSMPSPACSSSPAPKPRVVVAFSGGIDSTVLAHALVRGTPQARRPATHPHRSRTAGRERGLGEARRARRAPGACRSSALRADIRRRGESPEAAARDARYALLAEALRPGEVLVTAQHRDDQAKRCCCSCSAAPALQALPRCRRSRLRPRPHRAAAARIERADDRAYARRHRLEWVEDPTNAATRFGRNYLRHRVMPVLRENWPGVDDAIARSARHMAEARGLLGALAPGRPRSRPMAAASTSRRCVRCPRRAAAMRCAHSSRDRGPSCHRPRR